MTALAPCVGVDLARPGSERSAVSIWWRGRPLEVEARHFVTATARVSGLPRADLLSRRLGAEVVTWRRLGMVAAARCRHLSGPAVARAFEHDASLVAKAKVWAARAGVADPMINARIVEIQGWALAFAISELSGAA